MEGGGDLNFPPKKNLARQLDFNTAGGSSPKQMTLSETVAFPDYRQWPVAPPQPTRFPLPQQQEQQQPIRIPESPKARPRQTGEVKDGTPKKQKQCNCKHSRCLKLYCECFASGIYCDGCNCVNCHNNIESEPARKEAVDTTLERNPYAFRPKIASSPHGNGDNQEEAGEALVLGRHNKGCHCKKSGCLKKYCECFQANILCSDKCKCMDCKNYEGSEERQALFHGDCNNNIAYLNQAAHAAINGAIGTSSYGSPPTSRKRKPQELFFGGPAAKDSSSHRVAAFQQTNHVNVSAPSSLWPSVPGARVANNASVYRSLLADVVQSEDVKELCAVLVVYANEARVLSDKRNAMDHTGEIPTASDAENRGADESFSGVQADKPGLDMDPDATDGSKVRPMSPGTLALMCDEHDTVFIDSTSNGIRDLGADIYGHLPNGQVITESYAQQEKTVLTTFRDCLNKLITFGELKETKCSSMARGDPGGQSQKETVKSFSTSARLDPVINGFSSSAPES